LSNYSTGTFSCTDRIVAFHLHVPKLGGITVAALLRQIDFFTLHFNMKTKSFFDVVPEERFFDSYRSAASLCPDWTLSP
jgi:hypothetical protein